MAQAQMINLSINEIEQLCLKAARGGGLAWGMAEEAGAAAAWLVEHGIDGPDLLVQRLRLGALAGPMLPWSAQRGPQCPISLGAALCDHAKLAQTNLHDGAIDLGHVAIPDLLLPFLCRMARIKQQGIEMRHLWRTTRFAADGAIWGAGATGQIRGQSPVAILQAPETGPNGAAHRLRGISSQTIHDLGIFAMRTTVPASETSRAGAGAGEGDSD